MRAITVSLSLLVSTFVGTVNSADPQLPQSFKNLQVMPKDITPQALIGVMKQFCFDLSIRCEHCHVGEGNDLSKFDFASDERPAKTTARAMIKMVRAINEEHLNGIGEPSTAPKVTCFTCHRNALKPLTAHRCLSSVPH